MRRVDPNATGFYSVTALLVNREGYVLGVSRKNDPNDMGLPGGKIEPGETPEEACRRELEEETGLKAIQMTPIYDRTDAPPDDDKLCRCFLILSCEGAIKTKEKGAVAWVEPVILTQGTFGHYNTGLFASLCWYFQCNMR